MNLDIMSFPYRHRTLFRHAFCEFIMTDFPDKFKAPQAVGFENEGENLSDEIVDFLTIRRILEKRAVGTAKERVFHAA